MFADNPLCLGKAAQMLWCPSLQPSRWNSGTGLTEETDRVKACMMHVTAFANEKIRFKLTFWPQAHQRSQVFKMLLAVIAISTSAQRRGNLMACPQEIVKEKKRKKRKKNRRIQWIASANLWDAAANANRKVLQTSLFQQRGSFITAVMSHNKMSFNSSLSSRDP